MKMYQYLSQKLQKLSLVDFACIKGVYVILGVLFVSVYPALLSISAWAYLLLAGVSAAPLVLFTLSFKGGLIQKAQEYLKYNNPSNQVLTLISCCSVGMVIAGVFPFIASAFWGIYFILMLLLASKPFFKVFLR